MNQNESFSCWIIPTGKSVDHTLLRCQLLADNAFKVRAGLYDSSTPPCVFSGVERCSSFHLLLLVVSLRWCSVMCFTCLYFDIIEENVTFTHRSSHKSSFYTLNRFKPVVIGCATVFKLGQAYYSKF